MLKGSEIDYVSELIGDSFKNKQSYKVNLRVVVEFSFAI